MQSSEARIYYKLNSPHPKLIMIAHFKVTHFEVKVSNYAVFAYAMNTQILFESWQALKLFDDVR